MSLYSEGDSTAKHLIILSSYTYGDNKPIHLVLPSGLYQDAQCFFLTQLTENAAGAKKRPFSSIVA